MSTETAIETETTRARLTRTFTKLPDFDGELINFIYAVPSIETALLAGDYKNAAPQLLECGLGYDNMIKVLDAYLVDDIWKSFDDRQKQTRLNAAIKQYIPASSKKKSKEETDNVPRFNEIVDSIRLDHDLIVMEDNNEVYLYCNGVYSKINERCLNKIIRDTFESITEQQPDTKYIHEVRECLFDMISIKRDDIDRLNANLINFKNTMFDLNTFEAIPHDPKYKSIVQLNVNYDPAAVCTEFMKFLVTCELTADDTLTLMEFAGYSLTSDTSRQKALMLYGTGSNGKSIFINMLANVIGDANVSNESLQSLENNRFRAANLYGKQLNAFPDLKGSGLESNETFNILTGDDGRITAERKHENAFSFKPYAKLIFSANTPPMPDKSLYAFFRRWLFVTFPRTFADNEIDATLNRKLNTEEEKSGFINLALEGLKRLNNNGKFSNDYGVSVTAEKYKLAADSVTMFSERCCRSCKNGEKATDNHIVYNYYRQFCKDKHILPVNNKPFASKFKALGYETEHNRIKDTETNTYIDIYYYIDTVAFPSEIKTE